VAEDDDLAVEHRPAADEGVQGPGQLGEVGSEVDRSPAPKVHSSLVDEREAPPAIPLGLEHPGGAVGSPSTRVGSIGPSAARDLTIGWGTGSDDVAILRTLPLLPEVMVSGTFPWYETHPDPVFPGPILMATRVDAFPTGPSE
jgi:hypothetical protein